MVFGSIICRHAVCVSAPLLTMAITLSIVSPVSAAPFRMAIMGDSISAGTSNSIWVGQLRATAAFTFSNKAVGGAVSDDVVANQLAPVVALAAANSIDGSVLMIGGNDATTMAGDALYDPQTFIDHYLNNVKTVIDSISAASPAVKQVFANMPDVTYTPRVQQYAVSLGLSAADVQTISHSIGLANEAANAYALSKGIPVVDLYSATQVLAGAMPITLGGATFTTAFAADNFHPSTFAHGLIGNMVDTAFNLGYGLSLPILTDQKIAQNAGRTPNGLTTYFNVGPFVLVPVPEVSTIALVGMSFMVLTGSAIVRRRRSGSR